MLTWQDPEIDESSALLDLGDRVVTVNDSGDGPWVYVVDKRTGRTLRPVTYSRDPVVDVEALTRGPRGSVWVGDIGDNDGSRDEVSVYRLPGLRDATSSVSDARRFDLVYRGGPRDAETLLVQPTTGRLFVVSKGLFGGEVWAAPARLQQGRRNLLRPVGTVGGMVTDGAFLPDGRHVVLRSYTTATVYDVDRWRPLARMAVPAQPQGEGIAVSGSRRRLLLSSEGAHTPLLSVRMTPAVLAAIAPGAAPRPSPSRSPAVAARPVSQDDGFPTAGLVLVAVAGLGALAGAAVLHTRRVGSRRPGQRRSTT